MKDSNTHNFVFVFFNYIERLLSTARPIYAKNDNDERTNITKKSECKYKRIKNCLITSI